MICSTYTEPVITNKISSVEDYFWHTLRLNLSRYEIFNKNKGRINQEEINQYKEIYKKDISNLRRRISENTKKLRKYQKWSDKKWKSEYEKNKLSYEEENKKTSKEYLECFNLLDTLKNKINNWNSNDKLKALKKCMISTINDTLEFYNPEKDKKLEFKEKTIYEYSYSIISGQHKYVKYLLNELEELKKRYKEDLEFFNACLKEKFI